MKDLQMTERPGTGPSGRGGVRTAVVLVLITGMVLMPACIPDEVTLREGGVEDTQVREGRLGTVHPMAVGAGTVRALDAALDIGTLACSGAPGGPLTCVRGGITARGRSAQ